MRKLVLSLCVIAASGAYVARTAMTKDDGVQDLLDRVSFQPSHLAPDLGLSAASSAPALDDLFAAPAASSNSPAAAPDNAIVATAEAPSALSLAPAPAPAPVPSPEPSPALAVVPPLPRLAPPPPVAALAPLPAAPAPGLAQPPAAAAPASKFHDGDYTGAAADAYFGLVQVRAHVVGGKLASVEVLTYPTSRRTSRRINDHALPILQREVVSVQDAAVDIVSGATLTAVAYIRSLKSALSQAM